MNEDMNKRKAQKDKILHIYIYICNKVPRNTFKIVKLE